VTSSPEGKPRNLRPTLKLVGVAGIVLVGVLLVKFTSLNRLTDFDEFEAVIEGFGLWAPLIYVLIYAVGPIFLAPATLLSFVGGAVFGTTFGFVLITIGANLGAIVAFSVGRWASGDWVRQRLEGGGGKLANFQRALEQNGFAAILAARLLLAPYVLLNYAAALTPIRFRDFAAGTFLGMMPATFGFVFLTDTLAEAWRTGDVGVLLGPRTFFAVLLMVFCVVVPVAVLRSRKKRAAAVTNPDA